MQLSNLWRSRLGLALFILGIIAGATLLITLAWADLESPFYYAQKLGNAQLDLTCPPFVTPNRVEQVTARVKNPTERELSPLTRAVFSHAGMLREEERRITLPPGETQRITWNVSAENVDRTLFVFANVFVFPDYQFESLEGSCAAMFVDVSFLNGWQVFWLSVLLVGLLLPSGYALWVRANAPLVGEKQNSAGLMKAMLLVVAVGITAGYFASPLLAGICLIILILLLGAAFYIWGTK